MNATYWNGHCHTMYSNLRLLDCIIRPKDLIDAAIEKGLAGIAITDHESLSSHMEVNIYAKELQEKYPKFKIALGNEIYLINERGNNQKYFHFILIAKDAIGYRCLKELSSIAWYNSYWDRGMERVPLLKSELETIMSRFKGHVVATTACLGGELSTLTIALVQAEKSEIESEILYYKQKIYDFITYCLNIFGDDFYIECAPAESAEQIAVNKRLYQIAKGFNIKLTTGSDAHLLEQKDRFVHSAFLNSRQGERETSGFYDFAYLQTPEESYNHLLASFTEEQIEEIFATTMEIYSKIEFYDLTNKQRIPEVNVKNYPKQEVNTLPTLKHLFNSDNIQERYWVNQCWDALQEKNLFNDEYIERLEEEARIKSNIGEKLDTCMFAYPNTLQHYINLFWECGSTVGAGRGSACSGLNHYLLGITQLDPIKWSFPFWRYLNDERVELGDIDLDLAPSKRKLIFQKIREERGELGLVQVATFAVEGTKSAIQTACRGYRSEDYPDGIDVDEAQYLSSLVPIERGFQWSVKDLVYGNEKKDRKPNTLFINAINQYPGLLDIVMSIEGLTCRRGTHASGVMLIDGNNPFDEVAIMRSPDGSLTTQWDLHMQEAHGGVKYDFLVTEVQDIIIQTIQLLQKDNVIDSTLSLKEAYDKYLHPEILPLTDEMWEALAEGKVLGCFQFDSPVGIQAAKKIRPKTPVEMSDANGLMRLMTGEKGGENPIDKYVRFKNNIKLWYQEMTNQGLTKDEQKTLEPYFLSSYGVPPSQEQLMQMLMDPKICNFSLADANNARKIVGKKQMDKIPKLEQQVLEQAQSPALGRYVWKYGAGPQMGYSFSVIHATSYSFVGLQTLYLATAFNPIYWNTAYLIVNSASIEDEVDTDSVNTTNYRKMAKAISNIQSAGVKISLPDINKAQLGFIPSAEDNMIYFGLKGLTNVGDDLVNEIIAGRPYVSPKDFLNRIKPKRLAMVSLIKGGAFDSMMDRRQCMAWYIWETCDKKKRLTLQNMPGLIQHNILPTTGEYKYPYSIYEFNRYLKAVCKNGSDSYKLDDRAIEFLTNNGLDNYVSTDRLLDAKKWQDEYSRTMDAYRNWIASDKDGILQRLNDDIFMEDWKKYAKKDNLSSWEMEALSFYYHEHELAHVDNNRYGLVNFFDLSEEPEVERSFEKGGRTINIFKLYKICGTCIAKDNNKGHVALLTPQGVVNVKFRKEQFALFNKAISEVGADGAKHRIEASWFNKNEMIMVQGFRSGDNFIPKKYAASISPHTLWKIVNIDPEGKLELTTERYQGEGINE